MLFLKSEKLIGKIPNMEQPVLFNEFTTGSGHRLVVATLNSEGTLNALTLEMILSLTRKLKECEKDPLTMGIWVQGSGTKAFCAGGDIKRLYEGMKNNREDRYDPYPEEFFEAEYSCDYLFHAYPKPIIAWGNGIVMGGGLGLFAGSSIRVVTETSKVAMPEISIGLYPDVGATRFLSEMPDGMGLFLALTGARLNATDALKSGLATHAIKADLKGQILSALQKESFSMNAESNKTKIAAIFQSFADRSVQNLPQSELEKHNDLINFCSSVEAIEEIASEWKAKLDTQDPWLKTAMTNFFRGSPTSAKIILEQLKRASELGTYKEVFARELDMTLHFSKSHDFLEGVRALIIDKDNKPKWQPATLKEVGSELVDKYFTSAFPPGKKNPILELSGNV